MAHGDPNLPARRREAPNDDLVARDKSLTRSHFFVALRMGLEFLKLCRFLWIDAVKRS